MKLPNNKHQITNKPEILNSKQQQFYDLGVCNLIRILNLNINAYSQRQLI